MQLVGALQKLVGQILGFLEFREGLLLETWSSEKAEVVCSPGKVFCCHRLSLRFTKLQTRRERAEETTHTWTGVNYKACFSTALCIFIDPCTAETKDNLIPYMLFFSDCTYLNNYHFPIRMEHFSALSWKVLHISFVQYCRLYNMWF